MWTVVIGAELDLDSLRVTNNIQAVINAFIVSIASTSGAGEDAVVVSLNLRRNNPDPTNSTKISLPIGGNDKSIVDAVGDNLTLLKINKTQHVMTKKDQWM